MEKTIIEESYLREYVGGLNRDAFTHLAQKMQADINKLVDEGWKIIQDFNHPAVGRVVKLVK